MIAFISTLILTFSMQPHLTIEGGASVVPSRAVSIHGRRRWLWARAFWFRSESHPGVSTVACSPDGNRSAASSWRSTIDPFDIGHRRTRVP